MNNTIFFFFHNLSNRSEFFDQVVVFFSNFFPYVVILLAFIFLVFHHEVLFSESPFKAFVQKWKEIAAAFFSGIFAWALANLLKYLFYTARPVEILSNVSPLFSKTGYAFPSGHATFFMALAVAIFFSHKKAGYVFMFFALLIGVARIIAGVHFPVDILGGFVLGFLIAFFFKKYKI
jgi:undecaprenyl-diphosphatase